MITTVKLRCCEVLCPGASPGCLLQGLTGLNMISFAPRRVQHVLSALCSIGLVCLVLVTACGRAPQASKSISTDSEWLEFEGTWTAAGSRNTMTLGGDRRVAISTFNGSLLLAGQSRPGVGFRSEAIVFSDSATGLVGRAVWTDEHGDQAYSEVRGVGTAQNNKISGIF